MRILKVSFADRGGGAERVAMDLLSGYIDRGHQCLLAVGRKHTTNSFVAEINHARAMPGLARLLVRLAKPIASLSGKVTGAARLHWLICNRLAQPRKSMDWLRGHEDFEAPGTAGILDLMRPGPQAIHCHNLHKGFFDLRQLASFTTACPVLVTMHDEWLLTGHCAASFQCRGWQTGCGHCPSLSTYPAIRRDATAHNWRVKQAILHSCSLCLVTPSQWLMQRVEASPMIANQQQRAVVPNGVDCEVFCPGSRADARRRLALPQEGHIVLFAHPVARQSQFKDFGTFAATARIVAESAHGGSIDFVAVGPSMPAEVAGSARISFVPRVDEPSRMADYYRAADVYLHPARSENFPLAVLEAMACGCPVVASRVGGIPEQILDGHTGFLADAGDAQGMARAVSRLLQSHELATAVGGAAAARVVQEFSRRLMLDRYLHLIETLVSSRNPA